MSGYAYNDPQPTANCPYCGARCDADFVDVGVGYVQCGPFHCEQCGASEIGPCDPPRELSESEQDTGWYAPGQPPSELANVIGGKVVSHRVMRDTYRDEFVNNPLWHDKEYVEQWYDRVREFGHA